MLGLEHYGNALKLRADLWRLPLALCLATLLLFLSTVEVDSAASRGAVSVPGWISIGGPNDARAILGAMLAAVCTVLALIFSVAAHPVDGGEPVRPAHPVPLCGRCRHPDHDRPFPRKLCPHALDLRDHAPGGRPSVCPAADAYVQRVPGDLELAVLVVFSHRIAMSIQTQNVVACIVKDLAGALAGLIARARALSMLPSTPAAEAERAALVSRCASEGGVVHAPRAGFIQEVDVAGLLAAAERSDVLVHVLYRPGQFIITGGTLVHVLPAGKTADLAPVILHAIRIGRHRTLKKDLEFGIAQLVEIALRALSPAVNDTFTGLTCVDWLGDELRAFAASRAVDTGACLGASGSIRLVWPPIRFVRLVKTAFDQIRQAAVGNPAISIRLLQTLTRLAEHIEDTQIRQALGKQVEAIWEAVLPRALVESDRADIEAAYTASRQTLRAC